MSIKTLFFILGFCYAFRDGKKCAMKDGNPFGPFWDHFGVEFDSYMDHPGILWGTQNENTMQEWNRRYTLHMVQTTKFQTSKNKTYLIQFKNSYSWGHSLTFFY